ncbi:MAG: queuine tRNA-ribosyltransferase [Pirellulaceae bacterium]|jgi:queuine tRNA-ribosyltransferase
MDSPFTFQLLHRDAQSAARRSVFRTPHGDVQLPAFMPVGTQGTVKGLTAEMIAQTGAEMILGNTYHLALRPGEQTVRQLGGLHGFSRWPGPILTDSGGFQIFSLGKMTKVTEEAATFRSHIDGSKVVLSPERAIEIQEALGSDVAMVLDHVVPLPAENAEVKAACERTIRWALRCQQAATRQDQAQFAIVQGGLDDELRLWCSERLVELDFPGYAIGGLSVGEPVEEMYRILDVVCPVLPEDKPRYLMGVGRPEDLLEGVRRGVDLFDCVMPSRNGRNALAFTDAGPLRLRNKKYELDPAPLDESCPCTACMYSRGYIRHLFQAKEMLGPILLTLHNLTYYQQLLTGARAAILADRYDEFYCLKMAGWAAAKERAQGEG